MGWNNDSSNDTHDHSRDGCFIYGASPSTPGMVSPDISFKLEADMRHSITMDDGAEIDIWRFESRDSSWGGGSSWGGDSSSNRGWPSPTIRVTEGQIVHTELSVRRFHTIHHHGIEPSTHNDGVGHLSFDVDDNYTYQWRASQAGTYFYHCHVNTVLHFEMGMYGALIIDPVPDPNDPPGTRRAFAGGPSYDHEVIWACDEIDSSWRGLSWDAGICGEDVGLNDLNPDYFVITGVDGAQSALTANGIAAEMQVGETLLARYIQAAYLPQRIDFGGLTATVIASDGRPLPNPIQVTELTAGTAERYDFIFKPTQAGVYDVTVEYLHWVTGDIVGTARTRITVT